MRASSAWATHSLPGGAAWSSPTEATAGRLGDTGVLAAAMTIAGACPARRGGRPHDRAVSAPDVSASLRDHPPVPVTAERWADACGRDSAAGGSSRPPISTGGHSPAVVRSPRVKLPPYRAPGAKRALQEGTGNAVPNDLIRDAVAEPGRRGASRRPRSRLRFLLRHRKPRSRQQRRPSSNRHHHIRYILFLQRERVRSCLSSAIFPWNSFASRHYQGPFGPVPRNFAC